MKREVRWMARMQSGRRVMGKHSRDDGPALLFVELVAQIFAQSLELSLRLGTVDVDHEVLKVP